MPEHTVLLFQIVTEQSEDIDNYVNFTQFIHIFLRISISTKRADLESAKQNVLPIREYKQAAA